MKQLLYSALIGSLAFAMSAQAADKKHPEKKARGGKGAPSVQKAPAKMHGNPSAMNVQRQATKQSHSNAAVVHQNKVKHNNAVVARNSAAAQANVVAKNQRQIARTQNANIAAQQNAVVSSQQNLAVNRHRNVAITNNWNGSHFSGEQYSAFRNYHRRHHDRNWYSSRYNRIVLFGGGNYYWDNGYWYPAWGYNSGYHYGYDGPIYGYNDLDPYRVVSNVQAELQRQGYYSGSVDGSLGPRTRRALAAYQADHGLAITSAIDRPTLRTLGLV